MDGNYIKINRSILEWEWYKNINTKVLFLHMLLKANWKDGKFEGKTVPRGSFISSIKKLSDETELTEREIRTAILHLKTTGEVTSKSHNRYTVFTVVKYDLYQVSDKQNDIQVTGNRHSNDILTTTIEEKKEGKKERNNNSFVATPAKPKPATVAFAEDSFEIKCVDMLIASCLKSFPNSKVPKSLLEKQKWAVEIERMKRIDGRTESDIMQALYFAIKDSFWQTNIRSTKKFREKFETLIIKSKGNRNCGKENKFNQFPQRNYDFEQLEKELLANK